MCLEVLPSIYQNGVIIKIKRLCEIFTTELHIGTNVRTRFNDEPVVCSPVPSA